MLHENDTAERGEVVASLHANFTPRGSKSTDDSTWPSYRQTNLMAEFATGLAPGWEAGIHLPVRRAGVDSPSSREGAWGSSGVMLRLKHVTNLENGFFYGFNAEYNNYARRFDTASRGSEIRGIVGRDTDAWRITFNPRLTWGWGGTSESQKPDFSLDAKALYKSSDTVAWGLEAYTIWGRVDHLRAGAGDRIVYAVGEFETAENSALHVGIGKGFKDTPERTVIKAVWSTSF